MTGSANGVATLFRNEQPCLQAIHCYMHRLKLAYKDALGQLPMYTKLSGLLLSLYLFYHHSPLKQQLEGSVRHIVSAMCPSTTRRWHSLVATSAKDTTSPCEGLPSVCPAFDPDACARVLRRCQGKGHWLLGDTASMRQHRDGPSPA